MRLPVESLLVCCPLFVKKETLRDGMVRVDAALTGVCFEYVCFVQEAYVVTSIFRARGVGEIVTLSQ